MFDTLREPAFSQPDKTPAPPESAAAPAAQTQGFRRKMLSKIFSRSAGDFLIGAGMSAGVSTGTKLGAAALIGLTGAPVIVTAIGAAVVAGAATGAVRHAWNWHKDHRGVENAPSFWSSESGKKAFKSMLMSSVFAGAGGATFATLNHFYGDEIGAFVSKSANWLGLPSPEAMMTRAHDALAGTRIFHAATAVADVVTAATKRVASAFEVVQLPKAGTFLEKTKGFFGNLLWGAKVLLGIEPPLSNTPPAIFAAPSPLPAVTVAASAPALPAAVSVPALATTLPDLAAAPSLDLPPAVSPPPAPLAPSAPAAPILPIATAQQDALVLDLPGYFDAPVADVPAAPAAENIVRPVPRPTEEIIRPQPRPVQEAILRPQPRPVAELAPLPRPVDAAPSFTAATQTPPVAAPDAASFKINPDGIGFAARDAIGLTSYTIDPQSTASLLAKGADTALGFSGPIVPDTDSLIDLTRGGDITHFYAPSDDVLRGRLESALDGKTVRASTRALMDVAFAPADNAEAAAEKAQAMKDLAVRALNGQGGVPQNPELGLALLQSAAASENMQAKVDLAYIAYHGLHGVEANPSQALEHMNALAGHSKAARDFASEWTHGSRAHNVAHASGASGGSLNCIWKVNDAGHLAGGTCRGPGVNSFKVGDTVLVPVLKI